MTNIPFYFIRFAQLIDGSDVNVPNKGLSPGNSQALSGTIKTVMSIVFGTLGAIAVLIIVIAALQYVISAGDPQRINKAKNTIIYAVIGLIVAVLSYAIVEFVFRTFFP